MPYEDGWAALNLEMPKRIPRTEYSLELHSGVIRAATGYDIHLADPSVRSRAQRALYDSWNYDLVWSTIDSRTIITSFSTRMGHAVYQEGGVDFDPMISSPFSSVEEIFTFDPWEHFGRRNEAGLVAGFESHYQANCQAFPNQVNMTGIYVSCISGVLDLFGWNWLLEALGTDPVRFGKVVQRYSSWILQYFEALANSTAPVVMVHDDIVWSSGPFTKPSWYREFVFPALKSQMDPLRQAGKIILFTSDGNFTPFFEDLVDCGVSGFVLEPLTDLELLADRYGKTHVLIGNADTRILLSGTHQEIRDEVERCLRIGRNCPGYFMAVGNHIPPNTPVGNALYYNQVYEEHCLR